MAKTSYRRLLNAACSFGEAPEDEPSGPTSTTGREQNVVVIFKRSLKELSSRAIAGVIATLILAIETHPHPHLGRWSCARWSNHVSWNSDQRRALSVLNCALMSIVER